MTIHIPVLLNELLNLFSEKRLSTFVDATLGGAGHALALLQAHPEIDRFIAIDQDKASLEAAAMRLAPFKEKVTLVHSDFRDLNKIEAFDKADGMLFDLGLSQMQLQDSDRGFSFMQSAPLDMRKDLDSPLTAAEVINSYPEKELARIFWEYGEEHRSRRAAKAIIEARRKRPFHTTSDLIEVLKPVLTWGGRRNRGIHPMTLVFQALRIEVNDELQGLQEVLPQAFERLEIQGRMAFISFHSLEDRIVKRYFKECEKQGLAHLMTKKPIQPSDEECKANPASRSAKMRALEKCEP